MTEHVTEADAIGWNYDPEDTVGPNSAEYLQQRIAAFGAKLRRARKPHNCEGCSAPITAGERYYDKRERQAPGVAYRWHVRCLDVSAIDEHEEWAQ